jgi:hypothetical protein
MRYIFLTFLLLIFSSSFAQPGNYFLSHFSPTEESFDNVCFDIVQNQNGVMYFATRNGILEFDGRSWNLIPANGSVYSLQVSSDGTLYWAGANGFGTIITDDQGFQHVQSLSPPDVKEVFVSIIVDDKLYFLSNEGLYLYENPEKEPLTIPSSNFTGAFTGLFEIYGSLYLTSEQEALLKVEGNNLVRTSLGFSVSDEILFVTPGDNHYLVGLNDSRIFLYGDDRTPKQINLQDMQYAKASVIVEGKWLNPQLMVLATLRGGMIFVDALSGKTQEIVNYATGLPDNEVYTLMTDKSQTVWAAHEYGFTRVSPYLPFRSFSHYDGLQGNLLCVLSFGKDVYAGTSSGLFKLVQEEIYDEIVSYVDVELKPDTKKGQKKQKGNASETINVQPAGDEPINESKKRGFLRFLKKKKTKSEGAIPNEGADPLKQRDTQQDGKSYESHRKVERVLRSAHYTYKKVNGINAKVTQLIEANGHLIAAGLSGAFEIQGLDAKPILEEPARSIFPSSEDDRLFISTYKNEMKTLRRNSNGWISEGLFDELDDEISFMFQGSKEEYWLCAMDKVYRLEIKNNAISNIQTIAFPNPNFDEVVGTALDDKIVLANSNGFFQFDRDKGSFIRVDSLGELSHYFAANGNIWFRDSHDWKLFGKKPGRNLHLLNLYKDLRFVTADGDSENLWLITANNELYKFFTDQLTTHEVDHPLILKAVRNAKQRVSRKGKIQFDQEKSAVTFDVIEPDYLAAESIEYRFQLEGLEKNWSAWSHSNNTIDFPYLPPGDYSLHVQARDIFGSVREMDAVSFEVLPPYWKRTWFYALEFLLFASLVVLSFRLSTRYHFISRLLSLLTIILLIQFIQTVIGETFETRASPVMDFFIQVLVAVLILPVEGYLRNLLLRSVEPGSILHRLIPTKENTEPEEEQSKD